MYENLEAVTERIKKQLGDEGRTELSQPQSLWQKLYGGLQQFTGGLKTGVEKLKPFTKQLSQSVVPPSTVSPEMSGALKKEFGPGMNRLYSKEGELVFEYPIGMRFASEGIEWGKQRGYDPTVAFETHRVEYPTGTAILNQLKQDVVDEWPRWLELGLVLSGTGFAALGPKAGQIAIQRAVNKMVDKNWDILKKFRPSLMKPAAKKALEIAARSRIEQVTKNMSGMERLRKEVSFANYLRGIKPNADSGLIIKYTSHNVGKTPSIFTAKTPTSGRLFQQLVTTGLDDEGAQAVVNIVQKGFANNKLALAHVVNQFVDKATNLSKADNPLTPELHAGFDQMRHDLGARVMSTVREHLEAVATQKTSGEVIDPQLLLAEAQGRGQDIPSDATQKLLDHISSTPDRQQNLTLSHLYKTFVDELYPLKQWTAIAKEAGETILAEEDPFIIASQLRGIHGKADTFFHHQTFNLEGNWVGKSLDDILSPVSDNMDSFRAYLVAKGQLSRHGGMLTTGIEPELAAQVVYESEMEHPEFQIMASELQEYQDTLLRYAVDSGKLSERTYEQFKRLNPFYVPFYRTLEVLAPKGAKGGKSLVSGGQLFKGIEGSERDIVDPLESIVKNTYLVLDSAERNQVGLALTQLAEKHPDLYGGMLEEIEGIKPVEDHIINTLKKEYMESGYAIDDEMAQQLAEAFSPSYRTPDDNIISVWKNGTRHNYRVDPDLFRAVTNMDAQSSNLMLKIMGFPARMLRLGATSLSPDFLVRNPARDAVSAWFFSKYGFIPGFDWFRGMFSMAKKDDNYWRWKMSGAEHSMLVSMDRQYIQKNLDDIIATRGKKLKNIVKNPIDLARLISEYSEVPTRLAEFKLAYGGANRWALLADTMPRDTPLRSRILEAGNAAREVTLDFGRMGNAGRLFNQVIAFWNPNVQDLDKLVRTAKTAPWRFLFRAASIASISAAVHLTQKDDPRYQELPQWQKDVFWCVVLPDSVKLPGQKYSPIVRMPKPFVVGQIFGTGTERVLEYIEKQDPEALKEWGSSVWRSASPGFLPTAFIAPLEVATNHSLFLDRPIVSEGQTDLPPGMQYGIYTKQSAIKIGQALGVSPKKVEHFIRGTTGTAGVLALDTADEMMRSLGIAPPVPYRTGADIPMLRAFTAREPIGSGSESVNDLYKLYGRAKTGQAALSEVRNLSRAEEALTYLPEYPEIKWMPLLKSAVNDIGILRKTRNAIYMMDMDKETKYNLITAIEERMTTRAAPTVRIIQYLLEQDKQKKKTP